ncbi:hypothetical protein K431DRAFT_291839 [Polychaeton citri CBS 116435]|uniref:Mid2 domain-containing protein n=1 Tax=Polychaeton citri CBS 116435 TaxID=1314669 RepID=A0A9P4QBV1_9PEZI|nr:hypothetical protein K431DRAFT_291839 [Polychaeton citri CBS 116435]
MRPISSTTAWTYLAATLTCSVSAANNLTFLNPPDDSALTIANGSTFIITWATNYTYTDVTAFSGPFDDGVYTYAPLVTNATSAFTEFPWIASEVNGADLRYNIHFELANGEDHNCEGCRTNSATVRVAVGVIPSSSSAVHTATAVPPPENINSTVADMPTSTPMSNPMDDNSLGMGLSVGLGVGIPVILAAVGFSWFVRRRRSRRQATVSVAAGMGEKVEHTSGHVNAPTPSYAKAIYEPVHEVDGQGMISELPQTKDIAPDERWELDAERRYHTNVMSNCIRRISLKREIAECCAAPASPYTGSLGQQTAKVFTLPVIHGTEIL